MQKVLMVLVIFNILLNGLAYISYLKSEANLLNILTKYIHKHQIYLNKAERYLNALQASYNRVTYATRNSSDENGENVLNHYLYSKRIIIDYADYIDFLSNQANLQKLISNSIDESDSAFKFSDWTMEPNDIKLMGFVRSWIAPPNTSPRKHLFQTKTENNYQDVAGSAKDLLDCKSNSSSKYFNNWKQKLKERIISKIKNFKGSLKDFINATRYKSSQRVGFPIYKALCRGETLHTKEISNLKCKYVHNDKPYLFIGPLKLELLNSDPPIVMFHDALYDSEIKKIHNLALKRKMYMSQNKETSYRVAKVSWLHGKQLPKVLTRVKFMTNLNLKSAEAFQVSVYGLGGHYDPHLDSYTDEGPDTARISTVLFYLNDVKKGGATVFPRLNVTVWPRKGSAALWYNIKPSNEVDPKFLHAACPLYSGAKWVMNLWVKLEQQEFYKPCLAGRKDFFE